GVPVTKAAFGLLSHGPEDGGGKGGNALGGCEDGSTGDRVAFLRHGGGTAATLPGGLGEFADFGLRVQRKVAGHLAEGSGQQRERGCDFGDTVAVGVPGKIGERELQFLGECLSHVEAAVVEAGQGSCGAAELQHQGSRTEFAQTGAVPDECDEVAGGLEPEDGGNGLLQPGAGGQRCGYVPFGETGDNGAEPFEFGGDEAQGVAQLQNQASIDGVLAGSSPVHVAGGVLVLFADEFGELPNHGDGEVAGIDGAAGENVEVEELGAAMTGNCARGGGGNDSCARFGAGERRFEIEHALEAAGVGEEFVNGFPAEEWVEQCHGCPAVVRSFPPHSRPSPGFAGGFQASLQAALPRSLPRR